jgi:hypothetical protein
MGHRCTQIVQMVLLLHCCAAGAEVAPQSYDPTADFIAYKPQYKQLKRKYREELHSLQAEMIAQQQTGRKTHCTRQVFLEAKWYLYYTAHFDKTAERIDALRAMLKQPKDPHDGSQLESDGSFGCCSTLWFKKLDVTTDKLITMAQAWKEPKYPVKLLEEINSPEKLTAYLDSILISDVSKTGRDHRYEHNSSLSSLTRYIYWKGTWEELPIKFKLHPKLYETLIDIEDNKLQDPETGYWGAWYRTRDGKIVKTADLSHTFHIVHFRHGQVERWPQIIATTLAIKDREYPTGWLEDGKMTNHHNYDVALLLHLGFEHGTAEQKKQIAAEVQRMLDFCLKETLLADGSFKTDDEDTLGAAFYFGVAFLHQVGYFSKVNRFWTERDFPEASATNDRITARIRALNLDDPESLFALRLLAVNKIAAKAQ